MNTIVKKYFKKEILIEACDRYEIDEKDAKLIRSNSNLIYDCGDRILRLSHSEIRDYQDVEVEIDWINYLHNNNLSVVKIINSQSKNAFEQIGETDHFTIVCFEKIKGSRINKANWNEIHFQKLGRFVGLLHKVGQKYKEKSHLNYKHWNEIAEYKNHKLLQKNYVLLHEKLKEEFLSYPRLKENYSLVHYDIHHGNYLMENDVVLYDFEMTCKSWYISDVAAVVYYAKHFPTVRQEVDFEKRFLKYFWKGYENEYYLEQSEKDKIPKFLLYRDLLVLAYTHKVWDHNNLTDIQTRYIKMIEDSISKRKTFIV